MTLIETFSINARPFVRFIAPLVSLAGRVVPGAFGNRLRRSGMPLLWVLIQFLQGDWTIARRFTRKLRSGSMPTWWETSQRAIRSEEHTSELQSPDHIVCRLLLEKKNNIILNLVNRRINNQSKPVSTGEPAQAGPPRILRPPVLPRRSRLP